MIRLPRFQFFYQTRELLRALPGPSEVSLKHQKLGLTFLEQMKSLFQRRYAVLESSYRISLYQVLGALNLPSGDEVLLTPITIADTVNSILLRGLRPVLVDLDPQTHCLDLEDLKKKITPKSKVLILTYLSGIVPDLEKILSFARDHHLFIIEDFSQAMDSRYKNAPIGSHADVSIASLSIGKNISTLFGGLILTNNEVLVTKLLRQSAQEPPALNVVNYYYRSCLKVQLATSAFFFPLLVFPLLRMIGILKKSLPPDFDHDPQVSSNLFRNSAPQVRSAYPQSFFVRVSDFQLSLAQHQILELHSSTQKRRNLAKILLEHLSEASLKRLPSGLLKIQENNFYHFPIYCDGRKKELRKFLFLHGIDTGSYGLNLLSEEKVFEFFEQTPVAVRIKHDTLFLPIHESRKQEEMIFIAECINEFFGAL